MPAPESGPLGAAIRAAHAGGAVIQAALPRIPGPGQQGQLQVRHKGLIDLVTEVDLAAEAAILASLATDTPGVPVLAEEGGGAAHSDTRWIVDPLDGTTNFVHGFPHFGVSIALESEGKLVAGCIYEPFHQRTWSAAAGAGAHCDGQRIQVSGTRELSQALLLTGFAYDRRERTEFYLQFVSAFLKKGQGLRRAGAAALDFTHIACGRADGYWEFGLSAWDVAAGVLLVQEAGGRVSDVGLGPICLNAPQVLCSNGWIHEQMHAVMAPML